jgi:hypothetical protein
VKLPISLLADWLRNNSDSLIIGEINIFRVLPSSKGIFLIRERIPDEF